MTDRTDTPDLVELIAKLRTLAEDMPQPWEEDRRYSKSEIKRLNDNKATVLEAAEALSSERASRIKAEEERDNWKGIASQINTDWIPANKRLAARAEQAREAATFGCALAMNVLQSELYHKLDDEAKVECDALVDRWKVTLKGKGES